MSALDPFTVPRIVERIGGRRRVHHAPTPTEDAIVAGLSALLSGPYRFAEGGPGGWLILERPRLALGDDRLQPDLAGWRMARVPRLPDTTPLPVAPDFICEVEGPGDARVDRVVKRDAYGRHGVPAVWLLDQEHRLLEAHLCGPEGWSTKYVDLKSGRPVSVAPFGDVPVALGRAWP